MCCIQMTLTYLLTYLHAHVSDIEDVQCQSAIIIVLGAGKDMLFNI